LGKNQGTKERGEASTQGVDGSMGKKPVNPAEYGAEEWMDQRGFDQADPEDPSALDSESSCHLQGEDAAIAISGEAERAIRVIDIEAVNRLICVRGKVRRWGFGQNVSGVKDGVSHRTKAISQFREIEPSSIEIAVDKYQGGVTRLEFQVTEVWAGWEILFQVTGNGFGGGMI